MSFQIEIDKLLGVEGTYSDNPLDDGGPTNWGITETVARANGYAGDMQSMPRQTAVDIYYKIYWTNAGCEFVGTDEIACDLFECGVNIGVQTASALLQRAVNALSISKIRVDGQIGQLTGSAINAIQSKRGLTGMSVLRGMFLSLVSYRYITIVENDASQAAFIYGWELNRVIGAP